MRLAAFALSTLVLLMCAAGALAGELRGRVVGVTDGDTITVLTPERVSLKVRLREIDAPEHDQPYGQKAKQALSNLVFGRDVRVTQTGADRYGRTLGRVYVGDLDVSSRMVAIGAAWAYRAYVTDLSILALETRARSAHLGLWSLPPSETEAPWQWRHGARKSNYAPGVIAAGVRVSPNALPLSGVPGRCGQKRRCSQMTSCAEANFYLRSCGVQSLDGDGDGMPCERICR